MRIADDNCKIIIKIQKKRKDSDIAILIILILGSILMKNSLVMLKIGVILRTEEENDEHLDEIGQFLAHDLFCALDNGEDWVEVTYVGRERL